MSSTHFCCNIKSTFVQRPMEYRKIAGYASLITAVALIALACSLANGCFTPGMQAHIASYSAAVLSVLSLIPLSAAASILCASTSKHHPSDTHVI